MLFSEPGFLFGFLPVVWVLHALAGPRRRNAVLLVASLFFYAFGEPLHVLLLVASITFNTLMGFAILAARRRGAAVLLGGVAGNLALLGWFKYAGFVSSALGLPLDAPALPIGISFFTFQAISYLIDLQRGSAPPPRRLLDVALYISLFPQLIAGPIVRYAHVRAQLSERKVDLVGLAEGARRFTLGLAKKMLVANTLALPVDRIYALPSEQLHASLAWLAALGYTLQIYFDFSGYSDMAIGLGRMFGFRFAENFDHPYESRTVREFWRRWHISLSSWFRDYLFIPLGGSRVGPGRTYLNLWVVFLLCGLWHGASFTFVVWGAYHGAFMVLERALEGRVRWPGGRAQAWLARLYTLSVVVVGWVLFRAESFDGAFAMLSAMVGLGPGDATVTSLALVADIRAPLALAAGALGSTTLPARALHRAWRAAGHAGRSGQLVLGAAELAGLAILLGVCFALVAADTYNPFIYFRF